MPADARQRSGPPRRPKGGSSRLGGYRGQSVTLCRFCCGWRETLLCQTASTIAWTLATHPPAPLCHPPTLCADGPPAAAMRSPSVSHGHLLPGCARSCSGFCWHLYPIAAPPQASLQHITPQLPALPPQLRSKFFLHTLKHGRFEPARPSDLVRLTTTDHSAPSDSDKIGII